MEQYIQDWLKEHPEARNLVVAAWALGMASGVTWVIGQPIPKNPFREEPREEVKAA